MDTKMSPPCSKLDGQFWECAKIFEMLMYIDNLCVKLALRLIVLCGISMNTAILKATWICNS